MFCVDNETMKFSDACTINNGTSSVQLMQRVAEKLFEVSKWQGKIYIICGKGNNGGDGLALANILLDNGIFPLVFLIEDAISNDSQYFLKKLQKRVVDKAISSTACKKLNSIVDKAMSSSACKKLNSKDDYDTLQSLLKNSCNSANSKDAFNMVKSISECDYNADIIVDCIFGTGFSGQIKPNYQEVIKNINYSKAYKISVDIPSGLNGNNGNCNTCVIANKTVAIQCPKIGCFLANGKDCCGEVVVIDIGIDIVGKKIEIVNDSDMATYFKKRKNNSNKSSYGKSMIFGGCINFLGAAKLANLGQSALKSGGGLNVIAVPKSLAFSFLASQVLESTIFPIDDIDGHMIFNKAQIDECLQDVNSLVFGVGIGQNIDENLQILKYILSNFAINIVIDADGLNALSTDIFILKNTKCNVILTPHPKEMSRLCGISLQEILENPLKIAEDFAKKYNVAMLLKGASTIICDPLCNISIIINGTPSLSKGGSGDTLAGVVVGLLSQNISPYDACRVGAFLCAEGAKQAEILHSEYGVLPSDVSLEIAKIVKNNCKNK